MNLKRILSIILIFPPAVFAQTVEKTADRAGSETIALRVENDFGFSDRYYTNGLKLSYTGAGDDFLTSRLQFMLLDALLADGSEQRFQTVSVGQKMCVPTDINLVNPPAGDRPYAGWLYLSLGSHLARENSMDSFSVSLGVVGPSSLAETTQKFWHSLTGCDKPMGWHNQVKDEPGIIISYERNMRVFRQKCSDGFATDGIAAAGADLGNVMTQAKARALWRFGFNLPYSFSANRIDSSDSNDVAWVPQGGAPDWHLYMYAGGVARFVGYDITLDGNTYRSGYCVASKWLVGEALAGISARWGAVSAELNWTLSTSEFVDQPRSPHMFWTAAVKVQF